MAVPSQNKYDPNREKESFIQHHYRKCGIHAWMFSRTLAHVNTKVEIRPKKMEEGKQKWVKIESTTATKKRNRRPN